MGIQVIGAFILNQNVPARLLLLTRADVRWTKASEPLVVRQSEIVDLGAPQELQQEITAGTQTWIEQFRATPRAKYPDVKPIEHRGRAANEGQLVNRVGTIIELVVHFQNHALINIEAPSRDFFHDLRVVARIDQTKLAAGFPDAQQVAVQVAGRALPIIDKPPLVIRCDRFGRYIGCGHRVLAQAIRWAICLNRAYPVETHTHYMWVYT